MKLISKKIPYSLKRIVPMAMLAGATMFGTGCENNEPDGPLNKTPNTPVDTPVEPVVKVNKELYFTDSDITQISFDTLKKYLKMDNIDTIYMIPQGAFPASDALGYHYFELMRDSLESRTNLSTRIRGKGDFVTNPGHPSQAPVDSLWFVSKGWTVNKRFTR